MLRDAAGFYAQVVPQRGECRPLMSSHCANNNEIARTTRLNVKLTTDPKSRALGKSRVLTEIGFPLLSRRISLADSWIYLERVDFYRVSPALNVVIFTYLWNTTIKQTCAQKFVASLQSVCFIALQKEMPLCTKLRFSRWEAYYSQSRFLRFDRKEMEISRRGSR